MVKVNCFFLAAAVLLPGLSPAAAAVKPCAELQAEIEAKLKAHKVKAYTLNIVSRNADAPGKVVGTCENSSKKIMYIRK